VEEITVTANRRTEHDTAVAAPITSISSDALSSMGLQKLQIPPDPPEALRQAAEAGDLDKMQKALDELVDINSRDDDGRTALLRAALLGQTKAVKMLLAHGADPNLADTNGVTPLQAAMDGGHSTIIAALKHAGAH
jgi:ankyrin repeat protein